MVKNLIERLRNEWEIYISIPVTTPPDNNSNQNHYQKKILEEFRVSQESFVTIPVEISFLVELEYRDIDF